MQRRHLLNLLGASSLLPLATLAGCGFQLRRPRAMAFQSIQLTGFQAASPLATELARELEASGVSVVDSVAQAAQRTGGQVPVTHLVFEAMRDTQDLTVATKTAYGQVRSITARNRLRFQVTRADGSVLLAPADIALDRDLSYNEQDALAKQNESEALNRAMQTDIVQQVLRRLAAIRAEQLRAPEPAAAAPTNAPAVAPAASPR